MRKALLTVFFFSALSCISQLDSSSFSVYPTTSGGPQKQYIQTPITPNLQFDDEFTLECWVFITNGYNQEKFLIETYQNGLGGFVLRLTELNAIKAYAMGTTRKAVTGSSTIPTYTWNHLAATYSTTTGMLNVYLNGVLEGSVFHNISIFTNTSFLNIGARGDDNSVFSTFRIDEVRLWNVARTQPEIEASMNNCLEGNESGLVLYYDFENESSDGTVTDRSPFANNGVINTNINPYNEGAFKCQSRLSSIYENNEQTVNVFPNPSNTDITIEGLTNALDAKIMLYSALGELVLTETSPTFSVAHLPEGVYIIQVQSNTVQKSIKFIKK